MIVFIMDSFRKYVHKDGLENPGFKLFEYTIKKDLPRNRKLVNNYTFYSLYPIQLDD
jgi:hypothetical protein